MKKIFTILLAAIIISSLALTGCNKQPAPDEIIPSTVTESEQITDPSPDITPEPSPENVPAPSPENVTLPSPENSPEPKPEDTPAPPPVDTPAPSPDETDDPDIAIAPSGALSGEWSSFEAELDGKIYQLPVLYSEFAANGWTMKEESETLSPNYYDLVRLYNGDAFVRADVINLSVNVLTYGECYIERLMLDEYDSEKGAKLFLPGGIAIGSSLEDVRAAYGDPTDTYEGDTSISWNYKESIYATVSIRFDSETTAVTSVEIRNPYLREPSAPPQVSGEVPDSVKNYVAPSELGDSWDSFIVRYAGDLYALPAPVSVFVENGWRIIDSSAVVSARSSLIGFDISKNNQTLHAQLFNYSDSVQPAENCFIVRVSSSVFYPVIPLELPGGISMDSTYEDIISAYGAPDSSDESGDTYYNYSYGSYSEDINITINNETGAISSIEVSHRPRDLDY